MKVAVITESFPKLSETFVANHIKGLIDSGVQVQIFAFYRLDEQKVHPIIEEYNLASITRYKPIEPKNKFYRVFKAIYFLCTRILKFPSPLLHAINFFKYGVEAIKLHRLYEVLTFLGDEKYDIIHCHFGTTAEKIALYQTWGVLPGPLVTSFHGYDVDDSRTLKKLNYQILRNRGALYVSNSQYTKARLLDLGFNPHKIAVLPVCFDVMFFKKQLYTKGSSFNLVTIGRLVEFKGIEYSIRAVDLIMKKYNVDLKYTIVGSGPLQNQLEALIKQLNLENFIELTGNKTQSEIREIMDLSDVFLLTGIQSEDGRVENQGLAIQEAQAMELPVIVSDVGGVSEGMVPGKTGFLLPQKDIGAIAEKIMCLYHDPNKRKKMGIDGRKFVEEKYGIPFSSTKLINEYKKLLHE